MGGMVQAISFYQHVTFRITVSHQPSISSFFNSFPSRVCDRISISHEPNYRLSESPRPNTDLVQLSTQGGGEGEVSNPGCENNERSVSRVGIESSAIALYVGTSAAQRCIGICMDYAVHHNTINRLREKKKKPEGA